MFRVSAPGLLFRSMLSKIRKTRRILEVPSRCARYARHARLLRRAVKEIHVRSLQPPTPDCVVLVTDIVGSRVCKIAHGLKSIGWRTLLLHRDDPPESAGQYFDDMRRYSSAAEALLLGARFRPTVYHLFSNWTFDVAFLFVKHRPGKVVFDDYDVLGGTLQEDFGRPFRRRIEEERFCLENADGVCCRDLQTQCPKKRLGYRFRGKRILLWDCCWNASGPLAISRRGNPEDFHLVNCGNIPAGTREEWRTRKEELTNLARKLIHKGLVARHIHFHNYPVRPIGPDVVRSESIIDEGFETVRLSFHLYDAVPPDELPKRLTEYDAGIYHYAICPAATVEPYNQWKYAYSSGNRVFDYLDAGLPVVIHASHFMEYLMKRARADVTIEGDLSPAAQEYLRRTDGGRLRRNAERARSQFSIVKHATRLVAFYASI